MLCTFPQRLFSLPLLCHVKSNAAQQCRFTLNAYWELNRFENAWRPAPIEQRLLSLQGTMGKYFSIVLFHSLAHCSRDYFAGEPALQLRAHQVPHVLIGEQHSPALVFDERHSGQIRHERGEPLFAPAQRIFGLLGLLMIVFLVLAVRLGPDWKKFGLGFVPNVPHFSSGKDYVVYAYFAVALLSSIMLPYEVYFYASGAIEDGWKPEDITLNRIITIIGFSLGSLLGISLVMVGAILMMPLKLEPELPGAAALAAASVYGRWGMWLALAGMFFCFGGAAIENALACAYNLAQFCGWPCT